MTQERTNCGHPRYDIFVVATFLAAPLLLTSIAPAHEGHDKEKISAHVNRATTRPASLFILSPSDSPGLYGEVLRIVQHEGLDRSSSYGRIHSKESYDELFTLAKPGDFFFILLSAESPDRVPSEYLDILPESWPEIENRLTKGMDQELRNAVRGFNVIILAASRGSRLVDLVRSSRLLRTLPTNEQLGTGQNLLVIEDLIHDALDKLQNIKPMTAGQQYSATIRGRVFNKPKEFFLRKRSSFDIVRSGLSSGCGDYSLVFHDLMALFGINARYIESVEISLSSLITASSGHAVVAVADKDRERWLLVDPTDQAILSTDWGVDKKIYSDRYWIGFDGALEDYDIHTFDELKKFYHKTLLSVPKEIMNDKVVGLMFVIDDSLKRKDGTYVNPNVSKFLKLMPAILDEYDIAPSRSVTVRLVAGNEGIRSRVYRNNGEWTCEVGHESAMSRGLLRYMAKPVESVN